MSEKILFGTAFATLFLGVGSLWYLSEMPQHSEREEVSADDEAFSLTNIYEGKYFSFNYPSGWVVRLVENDGVHITSPDVAWEGEDGKGGVSDQPSLLAMEGIPNGFWLRASVSGKGEETAAQALQTLEEGMAAYGGWQEVRTTGGFDGFISTTKSHGTFVWARAFGEKFNYYFELNYPYEEPTLSEGEAIELLDSILESVEFR